MSLSKWILTGLGWAVGGPIGGLIGFLIGNAVSGTPLRQYVGGDGVGSGRGRYRNTGTSNDLNVAMLVLIAAVMKADGDVRRSELDYVKKFLRKNYGDEHAVEMLKVLRELMKQDIPLADVCSQIKVNTDYSTRFLILDYLSGLCNADGEFSNSEEAVLRRIAVGLGINSSDYSSIKARHTSYSHSGGHSSASPQGNNGKNPYSVLGIASTATDDEVRRAYRRLAMKYHPDRVEGLGEEVRKNAEAQIKVINAAYEQIKAARGIK